MARSLSNLADNLAEKIPKIKYKNEQTIKSARLLELKTKIVSAVLYTQMLKMIYYYANFYVAIGITERSSMKVQGKDLLIHAHFLTMIFISLFRCCGKV